jgi:hypothetical protein
MTHLTMQQLEDLGFEVVKSDHCDDFMWQIRKHIKHDVFIETTWKKSGVFISQEIKCDFIDLEFLKTIIK